MKKILCIGSLNVDNLIYVKKFCEFDGEEIIKDMIVSPGGQAGNIACGLGKLGKNPIFFGNIGEDAHTSMLINNFKKYNVDYSFAKKIKKPNSSVFCLINKEGNRQLYAYNYLDISLEDFSDKLFEDIAFVVFTSIIKKDAIELYTQIAKKVKKKGIKIILDPGNIFSRLGFEKLKPLLKLCGYFFPSLSDIKLLIGGLNNIALLDGLVPNVIITCGEKGVKFYKDGQLREFPVKNIKKEKIIDTLGAGDCFVAAFIASLLENKGENDAINFANHAAALSTTKQSACSMPTYKEVEKFINEK